MLNHLEVCFLTHPKDLSVLAPDPHVLELRVVEGGGVSLEPRGALDSTPTLAGTLGQGVDTLLCLHGSSLSRSADTLTGQNFIMNKSCDFWELAV